MPFDRLPLLRAVARRQSELHLSQVAAGISFWFVIAVFPAGLVVVDVLGLIMTQEHVADIVGRVAENTPGSLGDLLAAQLQAVASPSPGSFLQDLLVVVVAIWTVSTAMHHLIRGVQLASAAGGARTLIVRLVGVALAVAMIVALGVTSLLVDASTTLGSLTGYVVSIVVLAVTVVVIYVASVGRRPTIRSALPGALLAALGFVLVGVGVELYAAVAGNLRIVYGVVAGFIISMLAVWLAFYAVLVGAVLNAERLGRPADARLDEQQSAQG